MHYKNGRPAKNGDRVAMIDAASGKVKAVGILYDAVAGNDYCNGRIALASPNDPMPNLKDCIHVADLSQQPYQADPAE